MIKLGFSSLFENHSFVCRCTHTHPQYTHANTVFSMAILHAAQRVKEIFLQWHSRGSFRRIFRFVANCFEWVEMIHFLFKGHTKCSLPPSLSISLSVSSALSNRDSSLAKWEMICEWNGAAMPNLARRVNKRFFEVYSLIIASITWDPL